MTEQTVTQTEKKYYANVGKLFYNTMRRRLVLVERVYRPDYGNAFKYDLLYLDDSGNDKAFLQKKIVAIDFNNEIGKRFVEVENEQQLKKIIDAQPNNILR